MKNFLVIQTASIGDVILVTPVIEELHLLYPEANIDILVKSGNEGLFAGHPFLGNTWVWNKKQNKYSNLFKLIRRLRQQKYDGCINAQRFFSSGLITIFSGAKLTSGFDKNPLSFLFNHKVKHVIGQDERHEAERNLALIPGCQAVQGSAKIRLYPTKEDYSFIQHYQLGPYLCISPASLWFTKQYPQEKWIEFIQDISEKYTIFILGSEKDAKMASNLIENAGSARIINLCGKLSLLQSAALMEGAVMNYVNDSAPLHLCSARNAPVTAVFCSTIPAFGFGPYGPGGSVVEIEEALDCRPCGLHGRVSCPQGHFKCALQIRKEQLLNKILL